MNPPGNHDDRHGNLAFTQAAQEIDTAHARHPHIGDDAAQVRVGQCFEERRGGGIAQHVKPSGAKQEGEVKRHGERAEIESRLAALSNRERDVLRGLVAGRANKQIAFDLGISPRTVEIYRANLMGKMQAGSLSDLVRMALVAEIVGQE